MQDKLMGLIVMYSTSDLKANDRNWQAPSQSESSIEKEVIDCSILAL